MMVIEVQNNATAIPGIAAANVTAILPADRCVWVIRNTAGGGYEIDNVHYQSGAGNPTDLESGGTGRVFTFGYIGKSGRFVPISNPRTV